MWFPPGNSFRQSYYNQFVFFRKQTGTKQRKIDRITENPPHPGFLGEGHIATAVLGGEDYSKTDPFIMLMDDRLVAPIRMQASKS